MSHFMRTNHALPERVLLVTVLTSGAPRVPPKKRAEVTHIADGTTRIVLHYGFMETPSVPKGIWLAIGLGQLDPIEPDDISYIVGRETVVPSATSAGMARWRETIFAFMQRNSERTATWFGVPTAQATEMGLEIEI